MRKSGFGRWVCGCSVLVLALILTRQAAAVAPEIKDNAKFFSPDVVKKANEEIREIFRKYDKDLLLETFMTVPGDQTDKVKGMSSEERGRFFQNWAEERSKAKVVNGIYILVCKEPSYLRLVVTPKAHGVFDKAAQDQLSKLLLTNFREKKFDEGLVAAVKFVREKLAAAAIK
jgi:uncharacterized membrane protein YgcG